MTDYQICDLAEFLDDNDGSGPSPDEFLASTPHVEETIQIPEDDIFRNAIIDTSEKVIEGEISKMLRIAPGILPPVDRFPKSYKPPKPTKQPDFIPTDRFNKIPILLDEKYFKFQLDDDDDIESVNQNIREIMNNLDGGGSGSGNGNGKSIGPSSRSRKNRANISDVSNQSNSNSEAFEKRFLNVFCNDTSDEDNCNVRANSSSHQNDQKKLPQETVKQVQQYYNARQLYDLKRGKK